MPIYEVHISKTVVVVHEENEVAYEEIFKMTDFTKMDVKYKRNYLKYSTLLSPLAAICILFYLFMRP